MPRPFPAHLWRSLCIVATVVLEQKVAEPSWAEIPVPQTNVQLYRLLDNLAYGEEDVVLAHRAYQLATTVYSGRFQGDGKPFQAHGVGTAGILAHAGMTTPLMVAGIIHNVYTNGDFGLPTSGPTEAVRAQVKRATNEAVEQYVYLFRTRLPGHWKGDPAHASEIEKQLLLLLAAETLEKMHDSGFAYWQTDLAGRVQSARQRTRLMTEIGYPLIGQWLLDAAEELEATDIPDRLKTAKSSYLQAAPSLAPRRSLVLRRLARRQVGRLRQYAGRAARKAGLR